VVNFERNGVLLGQVRATVLNGGTSITVPWPTNQNSLSGALPGLSPGSVTVSVYNQTSPKQLHSHGQRSAYSELTRKDRAQRILVGSSAIGVARPA
jgi:hypothetical protein